MHNYLKQLKEKQKKEYIKPVNSRSEKNKPFIFAKVSVIESQGMERKKRNTKKRVYRLQLTQLSPPL